MALGGIVHIGVHTSLSVEWSFSGIQYEVSKLASKINYVTRVSTSHFINNNKGPTLNSSG